MVNLALLLVLAHLSASRVWSLQVEGDYLSGRGAAYPKNVDDIGSAAAAGGDTLKKLSVSEGWMKFEVPRAERSHDHTVAVAADKGVVVVGDFYVKRPDLSWNPYYYYVRGDAYIFDTSREGEGQTYSLPVLFEDHMPEFGWSVAIDDNVVVVGAPASEPSPFSETYGVGAAYIFDTSGTWVSMLLASDRARGDWFGFDLDVSNGLVVVSAPNKDFETGCVYMFDTDGKQLQKVKAQDATEGDLFGFRVALDGSTLVVAKDSVGVYIFDRDGKQVAAVDSPEPGDAGFGREVRVANGEIAISSEESVWIFDGSGRQVAEIPPPAEGLHWPEFDMEQGVVVVAFWRADDVFVFNTRGQQLGKMEIEKPEAVAIDASGLIVVGFKESGDDTTAYVVYNDVFTKSQSDEVGWGGVSRS